MGDRHVVHTDRGWRVRKENAGRPSASADTQADAVRRAIEIVGNDGGGKVVVHDENGTIRATHQVEPGGTPEGTDIAEVGTDVAASKAASATAGARDEVAEATAEAERGAESAAAAAQSQVESAAEATARGVRSAGQQAGNVVGGTIRRVSGLLRAAGGKAAHGLESTRNLIRRKKSR